MSHPRRALSLTLAGLTSLGIIACSSSPAATSPVSIPAIPTISIPAIPTISIPAIPTISIPAIPTVSIPAIPAIPTFHQAQDLENALPNQIRGVTLMKASYTGELFLSGNTGSELFRGVIAQFGKTPADLALAGASDPTGGLKFQLIVFRLAGIDANQLLGAILAAGVATESNPPTITQANIGGKNVTVTTDVDDNRSFVYPNGELLFNVDATADDALIADIFAALP